MNTSPTARTIKYVGLDVHAESIAVAIADSNGELKSYGNIPAHSHSMDRMHKMLSDRGAQIRYIYEAGPTVPRPRDGLPVTFASSTQSWTDDEERAKDAELGTCGRPRSLSFGPASGSLFITVHC